MSEKKNDKSWCGLFVGESACGPVFYRLRFKGSECGR